MNSMRQAITQFSLGPASLAADSGEQRFCFTESFLGFSGHFPGYAIVPGILQTLMAHQLAEQVRHESLDLLSISQAKFIRELRPGNQILLKVSLLEENESLKCRAKLQCDEIVAATFTLTFAVGEQK